MGQDRVDHFASLFYDAAVDWMLENEERLQGLDEGEWPKTKELRAAFRRLKSAVNRSERRPK